jgi:predicted nucleic acid-binding protein
VASKKVAAPARAGERSRRRETLYVESSALLRLLLEGDDAVESAVSEFESFFTSALTLIEVPRALARARREERLNAAQVEQVHRRYAAFVRACGVAEISRTVRVRAALEFPVEPVRSLDAIHLATAVVWSDVLESMVVASSDDRIVRNALALGYQVVPKSPS